MKKYEYGRIAVLEENLAKAGVAPEVVTEIMAGGETIRQSSSPEAKGE